MELEILILLGCTFGNTSGCSESMNLYYQYKGLDKNVEKVVDNASEKLYNTNKILFTTAVVLSQIKDRKISVPVAKNTAITFQSKENNDGLVVFTRNF